MLSCQHLAARYLEHNLLELTCYCVADGTKLSAVKVVKGGKPTPMEVKAVREGQLRLKKGVYGGTIR